MEVILLERVARLGSIGETVEVRNGYGRNFLIPMKKALRATEENKKVFEERRHIIEEQNAAARKEAEIRAKKIDGLSIKLVRQASQAFSLRHPKPGSGCLPWRPALGHAAVLFKLKLKDSVVRVGHALDQGPSGIRRNLDRSAVVWSATKWHF